MAQPTNREEFKEFCLRALGAPVLEINLSDEQIDDKVDVALSLYWDYHYDGTDRVYYKHQITQDNVDNGWIYAPENIIGAIKVWNTSGVFQSADYMFDIRYQIALNELHTLSSVSLIPYFMAMQHLALIQELLVPETFVRFNRRGNKMYLDMNWQRVTVGNYLIVECYQVIDPDIYTEVWKDRWLQNYATTLMKIQMGEHLTKYDVTMPGGMRVNGQYIRDEAKEEKARLEEELRTNWTMPPLDEIY